MISAASSTDVRIGGWSLRQYTHLTKIPALLFGLASFGLVVFGVKIVFAWTLLLILYLWLAWRVLSRGGKEIHLATVGWITGIPLGLLLGLALIIQERTAISVLNLVRMPILVALFGMVVASTAGFARHHRLTTRHLITGDDTSNQRKSP